MAANAGDVILGAGIELLVLAIATGVAGINDEVGTIILVFVVGILLAWLLKYSFLIQRVTGPDNKSLFGYLRSKGVYK